MDGSKVYLWMRAVGKVAAIPAGIAAAWEGHAWIALFWGWFACGAIDAIEDALDDKPRRRRF